MESCVQIAIDGPSGAGKSTFAKRIAKERNYIYLDTGAMYRSFGLFTIKKGISYENEVKPEDIIVLLDQFDLDVLYIDGEQQMMINGENVNGLIRTPEVSLAASKVAVIPAVRLRMVELQRAVAAKRSVVMDGRDIGTYVLKDAQVKIFLTASPGARAQRRFLELREKGNTEVTYDEVYRDMLFRDQNDSTRAFAPLKCAEDAILVDSSELDLEQTMEALKEVIRSKLGEERHV